MPIINEQHNTMFKYTSIHKCLNMLLPIQRVELVTHVAHYKHGKQEKKIQDVSL